MQYLADGRKPIDLLLKKFDSLRDKFGFEKKVLMEEEIFLSDERIEKLPICVYLGPKQGAAMWVIAGVHGEEPAGPNALFEKIDLLGNLAKNGVPMVVMPLCNPKGYFLNWRYPEQEKFLEGIVGKSVGDSEYLLPDDPLNPKNPRSGSPSCKQAEAITGFILKTCEKYSPLISIDLHEDNLLEAGYIYSQGEASQEDPIAKEIVRIFDDNNYPLFKTKVTRFGQKVKNGIVERDFDGSIDELLASKNIFIEGKLVAGPKAKSVIVVETSAYNRPLAERVVMQGKILEEVDKFWEMVNKNKDN